MTESLSTMLATISVAIAVFLIAWLGGRVVGAILRRIAKRSPGDYAVHVVEAWGPLYAWLIAAVGLALVAAALPFVDGTSRDLYEGMAFLLAVIAVAEGARRLFAVSIDDYVERRGTEIDTNVAAQLVPLAKRVIAITIYVVVFLIIADRFGIDVVALGAALGLTGFAIALALKDTINNMFAGIVIMVSRPFAIGDRIDVQSLDVWGDVTDIGIRSTTVVTRDNRTVIVPNSGVVDNAVVNYSRPDHTYRLELDLDLEPVVDMVQAQDVIRAGVRELDDVMPDKPIDVWFIGFTESDLKVRVRWWVEDYATRRASTDAVARAIVEATSAAGIAMPDPRLSLSGAIDVRSEEAP